MLRLPSGLESESVVPGFDDTATVGQTIKQCGCHFRVAEDGCPSAEAKVCVDHHTGPLIEIVQQVEEQRSA
ncbi:hypothetical protein A6U92_23200 [Agrobacterium rubi]|nr:hypothetical protein A6U92_23200 [Agrobacterium rubi]